MTEKQYEFPYSGECAFCGGTDARHRVVDAVIERVRAGDSAAMVAEDYDMPTWLVEIIMLAAETDVYEGFRPDEKTLEELREILLSAISAESEDRWAAGWMVDIEKELYREGGKWEKMGRITGWPKGYRGEKGWVSWDDYGDTQL